MQQHIFVSYSPTDAQFCESYVEALRLAGADVWFRKPSLGDQDTDLKVITKEIEHSSIFILLLSSAALRSAQVKDESIWYLPPSRKSQRKRRFIMVFIEPLKEEELWLHIRGNFERIEAPLSDPFSNDELIQRTLMTLGLTSSQRRRRAKARSLWITIACLLLFLSSVALFFQIQTAQQRSLSLARQAVAQTATLSAQNNATAQAQANQNTVTALAGNTIYQSTATAFATSPYTATVPGPTCGSTDNGWVSFGETITCLPDALKLDGFAYVYFTGLEPVIGKGTIPLPQNYIVSVDIENVQGCGNILVHGPQSPHGSDYSGTLRLCNNNRWIYFDTTQTGVGIGNSGTLTLHQSDNVKIQCEGSTVMIWFDGQLIDTDSHTEQTTYSIGLGVDPLYPTDTVSFNNFIFTPLS